ncbi:hypothetical protein ACT3UJ_06580 [Halomonas sp. 86]|uniref:hypothetical protein n=1 Tax=unclassified Halomonas TaxID=2609666 RepID=UPI004034329D
MSSQHYGVGHEFEPRVNELAKRGKMFARLGVALLAIGALIALWQLVGYALSAMKGPYPIISRLEVATSLFGALGIDADRVSDSVQRVTLYVGHSGLVGKIMRGDLLMVAFIIFCGLAVFCGIYAADSKGIKQVALGSFAGFLGLMVVLTGFLFIGYPIMVNQLTQERSEVTNLKPYVKELSRRSLSYPYIETRLTQSGLSETLAGKYLLAQTAQRVGADNRQEKLDQFLTDYLRQPDDLGFEPIPQHLYALEHAAYGEARTDIGRAYVKRRAAAINAAGLTFGLAALMAVLAIPFLLMGSALLRRVSVLQSLMGGGHKGG